MIFLKKMHMKVNKKAAKGITPLLSCNDTKFVSHSTPALLVRATGHKLLCVLLAISLVFTSFYMGSKPQSYANDSVDTLAFQASAKPFMNAPSEKPDFSQLTPTNWMSGIDNGRYLSEVNIPGAHDACTQHMLQAMSELKALGEPYAECQDMQYPEMLEKGVRILDLRLNNWYLEDIALPGWAEALLFLYGFAAWVVAIIIEWIIETSDANKEDDGRNCYIVHGDNSWGRTYWASKDGSDNYITFNNVLDTCKNFLSNHPSESIILYLADETTDSDQISKIRARAKGILQNLANEINPSTGEPYLYMEGGNFDKYTVMPKVGDVRGKIIIASNSVDDFGIGMSKEGSLGYQPGTTLTYNEENHYDVGSSEKWTDLTNFFNDNIGEKIPRNLLTHLDHMNSIYTSTNRIFVEEPRSIASEINPKVYTGNSALIRGTGTYYGWVLSDVVSSTTSNPVWKSNFPDDLEYCTVTVKTGDTGKTFSSPDQTFSVMKGYKIDFPADIYDELHNDNLRFSGWSINNKTYNKGDTFEVKNDITITANWDRKEDVSVNVSWDDGDNTDNIRPSTVQMSLDRKDGKYHLTANVDEKSSWKSMVSVYVPIGKKASDVYRFRVVRNEIITGRNTVTTYADSEKTTESGNFTATLTHTPNLHKVQGSIYWDDENDKDGARPYSCTVRLSDGGTTVASKVVSLQNRDQSDPNKWNVNFDQIPLKRVNGDEIIYTMNCEWFDPYDLFERQSSSGIATDSFTLTNTHTPNMMSINCPVIWNDAGNADQYRPDSVVLRLMADGMEVEHHVLNTTDKSKKTFNITFEEHKRYKFGKALRFTVNQNSIEHYSTRVVGNQDDGYSVINSHAKDKTSVQVAAHWLDSNNQDGKRPESLTIRLYADGKKTGRVVSLKEENNWIDSFDDLDIHNKDSKSFDYRIEAESFEHADDYKLTPQGDSRVGYDLVYEHTPEVTIPKGIINWDDAHNRDGVRPSVVRLALRQAGGTVFMINATSSGESDEWAWSSDEFPAYRPGKQGEKLKYSIAPTKPMGYDDPTLKSSSEESWIVNYHRDPQTVNIDGQLTWNDDENRDNIRPESVNIKLYRDDIALVDTFDVTAENGWSYNFERLPRYEGEGEERHEIRYSIKAADVEGYECSAQGLDVTLSHEPAQTDVHVTQVWKDVQNADGTRLSEIPIMLYANGKATGNTVTLSDNTDWMNIFEDLYKYDQGEEIKYSIKIDTAIAEKLKESGYSLDLVSYGDNNWSILASRAPDTVNIRGNVVWDDEDNKDGIRPESVFIHVKGEGMPDTMVVSMFKENEGWTWEATDLQKRKGGQPIDYTVSEDEIEGYTSEITGNMDEGYIITNKRINKTQKYVFTKGEGSAWTRGTETTLDFIVKGTEDDSSILSQFEGIDIDGNNVPKEAYETSSGSVVIKIKPYYLEDLKDGNHTIDASFEDGSAEAHFIIKPASASPKDSESDSKASKRSYKDTSDLKNNDTSSSNNSYGKSTLVRTSDRSLGIAIILLAFLIVISAGFLRRCRLKL